MKENGFRLLLIALLTLTVGCDHVTKHAAKSRLQGQDSVQLVGQVLQLRYTENHGVGFNVLRAVPLRVRRPLVLGLSGTALLFLLLLWRRWAPDRLSQAGLCLLLAGGLGNLIDRLARGYVVDFIHLRHWPVFNVADIAVGLGAGLLLLATLRRRRTPTAA